MNDIGRYLPFEISDRMIPVPGFLGKLESAENYQKAFDDITLHVILTLILSVIIWGICYWINSKKDLK